MIKCMSHSSSCIIRQQAALCLAALGETLPEQLSTMIKVLQKVVESHVCQLDVLTVNDLYSLDGNAFGLAALLELVPCSTLGVPRDITASAFECSKQLLAVQTLPEIEDPVAISSIATSGWKILNALLKFGASWASSKLKFLFSVWKTTLNRKFQLSKSPKATFAAISVRTAALNCLRTFIKGFQQKIAEHKELLTQVNRVLTNCLTVDHLLQEAMKNSEKALMTQESRRQIRRTRAILLDCYAYLPPESFRDKFIPLLKLSNTQFSRAKTAKSSQMDSLLDSEDDILTTKDVNPDMINCEKVLEYSPSI